MNSECKMVDMREIVVAFQKTVCNALFDLYNEVNHFQPHEEQQFKEMLIDATLKDLYQKKELVNMLTETVLESVRTSIDQGAP